MKRVRGVALVEDDVVLLELSSPGQHQKITTLGVGKHIE
jgi:hypothetical protein